MQLTNHNLSDLQQIKIPLIFRTVLLWVCLMGMAQLEVCIRLETWFRIPRKSEVSVLRQPVKLVVLICSSPTLFQTLRLNLLLQKALLVNNLNYVR